MRPPPRGHETLTVPLMVLPSVRLDMSIRWSVELDPAEKLQVAEPPLNSVRVQVPPTVLPSQLPPKNR